MATCIIARCLPGWMIWFGSLALPVASMTELVGGMIQFVSFRRSDWVRWTIKNLHSIWEAMKLCDASLQLLWTSWFIPVHLGHCIEPPYSAPRGPKWLALLDTLTIFWRYGFAGRNYVAKFCTTQHVCMRRNSYPPTLFRKNKAWLTRGKCGNIVSFCKFACSKTSQFSKAPAISVRGRTGRSQVARCNVQDELWWTSRFKAIAEMHGRTAYLRKSRKCFLVESILISAFDGLPQLVQSITKSAWDGLRHQGAIAPPRRPFR